jgi:tRNA (cmo5U34)-methyltransferase
MKNNKRLFDKNLKTNFKQWKFDKNVCKKFDEHVEKSVPMYRDAHDIILGCSDFFLRDGSTCYDLGSSTGTMLNKLNSRHSDKKIKYIGYDISNDMLKIAKKNNSKTKNIHFQNKNLVNLNLKKCDFITSLFTIQFVEPKNRQKIFNEIYKKLNWGGAFILCEKIRGKDARFQDIINFLYFDFKKKNRLSEVEILNKENALRGTLEPFTYQANEDYLKRAGFKDVMPLYQYLCFTGILAIK